MALCICIALCMNASKSDPEPQKESLKTARQLLQLGLSQDERDRSAALQVWEKSFADTVDFAAITAADCRTLFISGFVRGRRSARNEDK